MSNQCSGLPVRFTASITSRCAIASVTCCGVRPGGSCVLWSSSTRGSCILMCTDTSLSAADIIRLYGLRFKIECSFKQAPDRFILIPFLDERHDPVALPQRQSIPPSQIARLPQPCQTQNARLPCLHPGWRGRPGIAPVSRRRGTQACLEFLRVLAAHHSSRHPAIGVCRGKSSAPDTSRISHGSCKKRLPHEIHRRASGHAKHAKFPLGFVNKNRDS